MTPKEKAKELVTKFSTWTTGWDFLNDAKRCALIYCDDQISILENLCIEFDNTNDGDWWYISKTQEKVEFLKEVKQELEKL